MLLCQRHGQKDIPRTFMHNIQNRKICQNGNSLQFLFFFSPCNFLMYWEVQQSKRKHYIQLVFKHSGIHSVLSVIGLQLICIYTQNILEASKVNRSTSSVT